MTSTPRWTGWSTGGTRSRRSWPAATSARRPTRRRWRCSTCPPRGWKAPRCPLAARGYSRDGKKGKLQIEYGLLTDPEGRPVAVRVFPGNTGDPAAFTAIVDVVRKKFGLAQMVMVGDRGMITSARIQALNQREDGTQRPDAYGWITALRAPAIKKLMADDGPLQLSLFDQQDLAEITSAGLPRRAADRLPQPGAGRRPRPHPRGPARRHREAARPHHRPRRRRTARRRRAEIGIEVGKVISTYKTGKHFTVTITDNSLSVTRRQDQIDAEAALDGFYVLRTPVPAGELDAAAVVTAYKNLKYVERDFRHIKSDDLDLRPVFHRLEERVKAHVLICMLACYLTWHLRRAWAPLTFTDQNPPAPDNPVAPARRSAAAQAKASYQHDPAGQPLPQLPRPAGAPGHLDPQPGPLRRHPAHRADAHRADQRPARGLRAFSAPPSRLP